MNKRPSKKRSAPSRRTRSMGAGASDWYEIFFEDNPHPCWIFDPETLKFLAVNDTAVRCYGYSRSEFGGITIKDIRPSEDIPAMMDDISKMRGRVRLSQIVRHRRKDGAYLYMDITSRPVPFAGKDARLVRAIDVTQRRHEEEERGRLLAREKSALAEAQAANRAKDEFLAIISHELRTPMTAMLGWMWLLRSNTLDPEARERAIDIIERSMHQQAQCIDNILDVSNIVSGRMRLNLQTTQLGPLIESSIQVIRPAAEAKRIRVEAELDGTIGPVRADPKRLQQVVWNLLSNSVKFTPEQGELRVRLRGDGHHAEIIVSDNGQGIQPEFAPYLFDRFRQAELSMTRTYRGLGLGLSLVRDLIELHGGSVRASSEGVGRGSTFTVVLPLIPPDFKLETPDKTAPNAPSWSTLTTTPALNGLRILLVEDEGDAREMLAVVLEKYGAKVVPVATTAEALKEIRTRKPDILVADIAIPDEDGLVLIRKVRELDPKHGGDVPAAALTGYVRAEDRAMALRAGYQVHIPKPIDPLELARIINDLVRGKKGA